jgi:hypothetical protein
MRTRPTYIRISPVLLDTGEAVILHQSVAAAGKFEYDGRAFFRNQTHSSPKFFLNSVLNRQSYPNSNFALRYELHYGEPNLV